MLYPDAQPQGKSSGSGTPAKSKPKPIAMSQSRGTSCPQRRPLHQNLPQRRSPSKKRQTAASPSTHLQNKFAAATRSAPDKMPRLKSAGLLYPRSYTPPLTSTEPMNIKNGSRSGRQLQARHRPPAFRRTSARMNGLTLNRSPICRVSMQNPIGPPAGHSLKDKNTMSIIS